MSEGVCKYGAGCLVVACGGPCPHSAQCAMAVVNPAGVIPDLEDPEEGVQECEGLVSVHNGVGQALVFSKAQDVFGNVVRSFDLPPELIRLNGFIPGEVQGGDEDELLSLGDVVFWYVGPEVVCVVVVWDGMHGSARPLLSPLPVPGSSPPVHDSRNAVQRDVLCLPPLVKGCAYFSFSICFAPEKRVYVAPPQHEPDVPRVVPPVCEENGVRWDGVACYQSAQCFSLVEGA